MDKPVDQIQSSPGSDPDDFDPQRYLDGVNPVWMDPSLENRVRFALTKAGFVDTRLEMNVDSSMATFAGRAPFTGAEEGLVVLHQRLKAAGCEVGWNDVVLEPAAEGWSGAYTPPMPRTPPDPDDFDAMEFIIAHQPPFV